MPRRQLDPERGRAVAAELRALGVRGILITAAERGYIIDAACNMPQCFCPEELGGREYFEPVSHRSDWSPTHEHFPRPKGEGGQRTVENTVLAHRLCNRIDYSIGVGKPHGKDLERVSRARNEAIRRAAFALRGQRVLLRMARADDVDPLCQIRGEPEVFKRWGDFDAQEIKVEFVGSDAHFVIEVDGQVVGGIQYEEEQDLMYRHANIDIFLTASHHGQGLATEAIRLLAHYLFEERGHHRLTIDPALDNHAAIRAYERVGFRRVGVMRKYERGPNGSWHDSLLMDMLREDLCD